jgi:hypothetical protein
MQTLAVEPPGAALDRRVLDSLPAAEVVERRSQPRWSARRKSFALGLAALTLTAMATAGMVTVFFRPQGGGDFPLNGRTWSYRSNFTGEVTFRDPHGRRVGGVVEILDGKPGKGAVELKIQGHQYRFTTPGEHLVRDAQGQLLGSTVLRVLPIRESETKTLEFLHRHGIQQIPKTPDELLKAQRQIMDLKWQMWGMQKESGLSGASTMPLGVMGYHNELGVYWKVRGLVAVRAQNAEGADLLGVSTQPAAGLDVDHPELPEITVVVGGTPAMMHGYGLHEIRDEQGRLLLTLSVQPFQLR